MKYSVFTSKKERWVCNDKYLLLFKKRIPLEQVNFFVFKNQFKSTYLVSFQYKPTVFFNILWLEEDELVTYLLGHERVNRIDKEVVQIKYRSDTEGYLALDDGTALSWSSAYDTGSYNVWFHFGDSDDKKVRKPVILPLSVRNKQFVKTTEEVEEKSQSEIVEGIIPLNPWEKNEAYWVQHFKLNKPKGPGCAKIFVIAIIFFVILFFILSLLP